MTSFILSHNLDIFPVYSILIIGKLSTRGMNEMKHLTQIRIIKKIVKKACKELKLYSIEIRYNTNDRIYFSMSKKTGKGCLQIDYIKLLQYLQFDKEFLLNRMYNLDSVHKRLRFILYHELGHYLHYYKYTDSFLNEYTREKIIRENVSQVEYRKLKLERIADKIALGLMKRG